MISAYSGSFRTSAAKKRKAGPSSAGTAKRGRGCSSKGRAGIFIGDDEERRLTQMDRADGGEEEEEKPKLTRTERLMSSVDVLWEDLRGTSVDNLESGIDKNVKSVERVARSATNLNGLHVKELRLAVRKIQAARLELGDRARNNPETRSLEGAISQLTKEVEELRVKLRRTEEELAGLRSSRDRPRPPPSSNTSSGGDMDGGVGAGTSRGGETKPFKVPLKPLPRSEGAGKGEGATRVLSALLREGTEELPQMVKRLVETALVAILERYFPGGAVGPLPTAKGKKPAAPALPPTSQGGKEKEGKKKKGGAERALLTTARDRRGWPVCLPPRRRRPGRPLLPLDKPRKCGRGWWGGRRGGRIRRGGLGGISVVGCYLLSNTGRALFEEVLDGIAAHIMSCHPRPVLVLGDFNSKSVS